MRAELNVDGPALGSVIDALVAQRDALSAITGEPLALNGLGQELAAEAAATEQVWNKDLGRISLALGELINDARDAIAVFEEQDEDLASAAEGEE